MKKKKKTKNQPIRFVLMFTVFSCGRSRLTVSFLGTVCRGVLSEKKTLFYDSVTDVGAAGIYLTPPISTRNESIYMRLPVYRWLPRASTRDPRGGKSLKSAHLLSSSPIPSSLSSFARRSCHLTCAQPCGRSGWLLFYFILAILFRHIPEC